MSTRRVFRKSIYRSVGMKKMHQKQISRKCRHIKALLRLYTHTTIIHTFKIPLRVCVVSEVTDER